MTGVQTCALPISLNLRLYINTFNDDFSNGMMYDVSLSALIKNGIKDTNPERIKKLRDALLSETNKLTKKLEKHESEIKEYEDSIKIMKPREIEILETLTKHPEELIKHLRQQLEDEKEHRNEYQQQKERISAQRTDYILKYFAPLILNQSCLDAYQIIKDAENAKIIPPQITATFVSEKIEEGTCICGNDLHKDKDEIGRAHV